MKLAPDDEKKLELPATAGSALRNTMLKSLLLTFEPVPVRPAAQAGSLAGQVSRLLPTTAIAPFVLVWKAIVKGLIDRAGAGVAATHVNTDRTNTVPTRTRTGLEANPPKRFGRGRAGRLKPPELPIRPPNEQALNPSNPLHNLHRPRISECGLSAERPYTAR